MDGKPAGVKVILSRLANSGIGMLGLAFLVGLATFAISVLTIDVARDIGQLNSADSDNIQWSLTQAEVEFLEFERDAILASQSDTPDFSSMRREFDIFYSRLDTLSQSSIYADLRREAVFGTSLSTLRGFLDDMIPLIDGPDDRLQTELPQIIKQAQEMRPVARKLSNSGLTYFANLSDQRRHSLLGTLSELAVAIGLLTLALVTLSLLLNAVNKRNRRNMVAARNSQDRTETIINTSLDAVIVTDLSGRVLDYNDAAETIFGYSRNYALGKELGELIVPEKFRDAHAAGMERMRKSGERRVVGQGRVKLEGMRADGSSFPVELALQNASTAEGEIFVAFLRDISARIAADEELILARDKALESERAKTNFLATMSHEIRTPLNGLLGSLTLLQDTKLNAKQSTYVSNMEKSGRLLMNHIADVLDITTYDAGKLAAHLGPINLSTVLEDIVSSQSSAAMANGSNLEWGWVGDPIEWIETDKRKIQHILVNLVGNAIKFTHDGRISIEAEVTEDETGQMTAHLRVSDSGSGIAPDMVDRIFDDFVTGDASYNRDVGGTGLGLGIVKRFVKALGGKVQVESTAGDGTQFMVSFPTRIVTRKSRETTVESNTQNFRALNILLVEDNEINQFVAQEMLQKAGHQVTTADNGEIGVALANARHFDLIFMDISMPVMDGREATRTIRAGDGASCSVPIIALTANVLPHEHEAFLLDGMNDLVTKPLSAAALAQITSKWSSVDHTETTHMSNPLLSDDHFTEMREMIGSEQHDKLFQRVIGELNEFVGAQANPTADALPEVAKAAHKIAGGAAAIGALDITERLRNIEIAAKSGDLPTVTRAIAALPEVCARTLDEFNARSA